MVALNQDTEQAPAAKTTQHWLMNSHYTIPWAGVAPRSKARTQLTKLWLQYSSLSASDTLLGA